MAPARRGILLFIEKGEPTSSGRGWPAPARLRLEALIGQVNIVPGTADRLLRCAGTLEQYDPEVVTIPGEPRDYVVLNVEGVGPVNRVANGLARGNPRRVPWGPVERFREDRLGACEGHVGIPVEPPAGAVSVAIRVDDVGPVGSRDRVDRVRTSVDHGDVCRLRRGIDAARVPDRERDGVYAQGVVYVARALRRARPAVPEIPGPRCGASGGMVGELDEQRRNAHGWRAGEVRHRSLTNLDVGRLALCVLSVRRRDRK